MNEIIHVMLLKTRLGIIVFVRNNSVAFFHMKTPSSSVSWPVFLIIYICASKVPIKVTCAEKLGPFYNLAINKTEIY